MHSISRTGLVALAALGCATTPAGLTATELPPPASNTTASGDGRVTDRIAQVAHDSVDVLFVVDDSESMSPYLQALTEAFPTFMSSLEGTDVDYHVGITTTDLADSCYATTGEQVLEWFDSDTPTPATSFLASAPDSTEGSGCDNGLAATFVAIADLGQTDGFYRPDAALHTIVITDQDEQTEGDSPPVITLDEFVDWYDGLKASPDDRSFSSIVPAELSVGDPYVQVTDEIGGIVADLHDDDVHGLLDDLGVLAAGLKREFYLRSLPEPDTIEVAVVQPDGGVSNKVEGEADAGGDWVYDEVRNAIVFHTFVPEPLDTVEVSYVALAARRSAPPGLSRRAAR